VRIAVFADDTSLFDYEPTYKITLKNKHKGDVWLADVEGIANKEEADALKAIKLYCDRDQLTPPSDDEIYFADMVGMKCVDEDGIIIGTVESVDNFGAGDLLDIKPPQGPNFFISYDDNTVLSINDKITVRMPEIL
jgi:16S rRNA processing protein RimM